MISKSQADKIGDELRHGPMTADLIERLSAYREQLVLDARGAWEAIRALTPDAVIQREGKSTGSIVAKLRRLPIALSRMQDIVGCRIVVGRVRDQDSLSEKIAARFPAARLIDRRIRPSYGYRAVHFVLQWGKAPYEVQVRTHLQHAWAEVVERLSDRIYPDLKYGKIEGTMPDFIERLSKVIGNIEDLEHPEDQLSPDESSSTDQAEGYLSIVRAEVLHMLDALEVEAKS